MGSWLSWWVLVGLLAMGIARGQVARDTTVAVSAAVQEVPPQIALSWTASNQSVTGQKVYRRLKGASAWTDVATLATTALGYVDGNVVPGTTYEYFVYRMQGSANPNFAAGYLTAGIRVPLVESRGRAILLVDDSMAAPLAAELARLEEDLAGDGWTVVRRDVARTAAVPAVKGIVQEIFRADPEHTRALILFGRVPVPYAGDMAPDGHPDHRGAWPADVYYGDIDGVWTDTEVDDADAERVANRNVPGDGKFDQSEVPGRVELEIGRIDLSNMGGVPTGTSETELLRQYLNRDHAFRHRAGAYANIPRRGLIDDNFGYFSGEAFAASGWRNFTSFFGTAAGSVVAADWFGTLGTDAYLCAYGCGAGAYTSADGVGISTDFGTKKSLAVFNMMLGSYFGDWDVTNSFLRAPLAGRADSLGLVNVWAGRPHWHLYAMALGETVGYGVRVTQNNSDFTTGGYVVNNSARGIHIALMGDPTLRLHPVLPVTNLAATSGAEVPTLSWTASGDTGIEGYAVYRADAAAGPWSRLGAALATSLSFTDRTGTPGHSYTYMVRAVKLETSASGSYLNPSQGMFAVGGFGSGVAREINLSGNGRLIANDDTGTSTDNGTDFGSAEANVQTVTHTFNIANDGTAALTLMGTPAVLIAGPDAADFVVVTQPGSEVAAGGSASFAILFTPTVPGTRVATVTIASDDPDESTFQFTIRGTALPPSPSLALAPTAISRTLAPGGAETVPVTLDNTGPGVLQYVLTSSQAGYSFRDSNSFGGPGYAWIDIRGSGTEITGFSNLDDATSAALPLGFTFPFFGKNFTTVRVCTNGFISFSDAASPAGNGGLPSLDAPRNLLAAVWDDLMLDSTSKIFTQQLGDAFVVMFDNLRLFSSETQRVTCEIVLRPSGEMLLQYQAITETDHSYTIGLQNEVRDQGLQIALNTDFVQPGLAILIAPPGRDAWLEVSDLSGSVPGHASHDVPVTLNAAGVAPGFYHAALALATNDAATPLRSIPVTLTVTGPRAEVLGNGLAIANGDTTPRVIDQTAFGTVVTAGGSAARSFTLRNAGSTPLTIGPVAVTGAGFALTTAPADTLAPLASTTFLVTFAPTAAGAVTSEIRFATNDSANPYHFAISGTGQTPFEAWLAGFNFTAFTNPNLTPAGDPDHDGQSNWLEYTLGTDPTKPTLGVITWAGGNVTARGTPVAHLVRTPSGGADFVAVFGRRKDAATVGLTYTPQFSTDLATWVDASADPVVLASDAEIDAVSVTLPLLIETPHGPAPPMFFRVRVVGN